MERRSISKISILFIESGTSNGGSFVSLYQHLEVIDRELYQPVVVYLNQNRFVTPVKLLDIPVFILTDLRYSNVVNDIVVRILSKIMRLIECNVPRLYINFMRLVHKPITLKIERLIDRHKIDIIHLNNQVNRDLFGLFVSEKKKVHCISHLRSLRSSGFDSFRADFANRTVSLFIANSNATKEHWLQLGLDEEKIKLVYNAINNEPVKPVDIRKRWKIDFSKRFIIGCVGIFSSGKGHAFLLDAFAQLLKIKPDVVLLLIGDGPLKCELEQQIATLGIYGHVIFTGYLLNVKAFIAGLDILILPSQTEAFGRVLLEAMQMGTAIVSTDSGGIPEIVQHGYNGVLISYGDKRGLQKAMERVLIDEKLRSQLIENGRQTVVRFSIENYAAKLEAIHRAVLRK